MNRPRAIRLALLLAVTVEIVVSREARGAEVPYEPSTELTAEDRASEERSIRFYSDLIESEPDYAGWYLSRSSSLRRIGDTEGAAQDLAAVRKLDPYRADVEEGSRCYWSDDLKAAERLLTRAIDSEPKRDEAYYYRALVHARQRRFRRALTDLDRSLEYSEPMSQDVCRAYYEKAKIHHHLGQYEDAVDAVTCAIDRHFSIAFHDAKRGIPVFPLDPHYYFLRASSYMELDDHRRAIDDFTTCEELGFRWRDLYEERANCFRALGEIEREKADRARCEFLHADKLETHPTAKRRQLDIGRK